MAYRVKKQFADIEGLRTLLKSGKAVALNAAHVKQVKGTASAPPKEVHIPLATQAELKELFDSGNPCIEQVADAPKKPENPENPFENYVPEFPVESGVEEKLEEGSAVFEKKKK